MQDYFEFSARETSDPRRRTALGILFMTGLVFIIPRLVSIVLIFFQNRQNADVLPFWGWLLAWFFMLIILTPLTLYLLFGKIIASLKKEKIHLCHKLFGWVFREKVWSLEDIDAISCRHTASRSQISFLIERQWIPVLESRETAKIEQFSGQIKALSARLQFDETSFTEPPPSAPTPASIWRRASAAVLDLLFFVSMLHCFPGVHIYDLQTQLILLVLFLTVYHAILESSTLQGSFGKLALDLQVISNKTGRGLTLPHAFLHGVFRSILFCVAAAGAFCTCVLLFALSLPPSLRGGSPTLPMVTRAAILIFGTLISLSFPAISALFTRRRQFLHDLFSCCRVEQLSEASPRQPGKSIACHARLLDRGLAFLLDLMIISASIRLLYLVPAGSGQPIKNLLILFLLPFIYFSVFEDSKLHATPGKHFLGLKTVRQKVSSDDSIGSRNAFIRAFFKTLTLIPIFFAVIINQFFALRRLWSPNAALQYPMKLLEISVPEMVGATFLFLLLFYGFTKRLPQDIFTGTTVIDTLLSSETATDKPTQFPKFHRTFL